MKYIILWLPAFILGMIWVVFWLALYFLLFLFTFSLKKPEALINWVDEELPVIDILGNYMDWVKQI